MSESSHRILLRRIAAMVLLGLFATPIVTHSSPVTVTDDTGKTISLARQPARIVSLSPGATELLFAAGAGSQVVGTVVGADAPEAAKKIERLGDVNALKYERLQALKPDVIVVWRDMTHELVLESLQKLRLPIYQVSLRSFDEMPASIRRLGRLAGTTSAAEMAARPLEDRIAALPKRPSPQAIAGAPAIFFMMWDVPLYTVGSRHLMNDALLRCGMRNIFDDIDFPAPIVEFEEIKKRNPDVILMGAPPITSRDWRERWSRFPEVTAVATRQMTHFVDIRLTRMGPTAIDAVPALCEQLKTMRKGAPR
ncbi:MAG: helical backbone metal receptor [Steroidobacteraceae bacterium]